MKRLYLSMIISNKILLFPITILLLHSCNSEKEVKNSSSQKSDSTQSESVDTNEVTSDYKTDDDKNLLTDPNELLNQIKNGKTKVLFHGIVTEPFLDIYLTENELLYIDNGSEIQESYLLVSKFDKNLKSQEIIYMDKSGKQRKLEIKKESAGDGMSDRTYPYQLIINGWQGGGDSKRMVDWSEYEK